MSLFCNFTDNDSTLIAAATILNAPDPQILFLHIGKTSVIVRYCWSAICKWGWLQRMKPPLMPHLARLCAPCATFAAHCTAINKWNMVFLSSLYFILFIASFQSLYLFHSLPSLYSTSPLLQHFIFISFPLGHNNTL